MWFGKGKKVMEIDYKNGKRHGKEVYWRENGEKYIEINWKDGKKVNTIGTRMVPGELFSFFQILLDFLEGSL